MSPLAEKLAAVLADWDELSATLNETRKQLAAKDETIESLRQQIAQQANHQAVQAAEMREEMNELQEKLASSLLTASDPDDVKLKSWIEAAYETIGPRTSAATAKPDTASKSGGGASAAKIAAALSSPVSGPSDVAAPAAKTAASSRPARSASPTATSSPAQAAAATPVGQAASLRDVVFKLVE